MRIFNDDADGQGIEHEAVDAFEVDEVGIGFFEGVARAGVEVGEVSGEHADAVGGAYEQDHGGGGERHEIEFVVGGGGHGVDFLQDRRIEEGGDDGGNA